MLGRGRGLLLSSVVGTPLGEKNMQNKGGGDAETGAKDFQRGGSQTWLGRVALHPGRNGFFGGRNERSNRGQTVWLARFGVGSSPITRRYFFGVHRRG